MAPSRGLGIQQVSLFVWEVHGRSGEHRFLQLRAVPAPEGPKRSTLLVISKQRNRRRAGGGCEGGGGGRGGAGGG
eukprot:2395573-Pyramimonas_sp.AAC.1